MAIIQKKKLAKFGYILNIKLGKKEKKNLLYSWLPIGIYHKLMIEFFFSNKIW
jgi:hypothetical protein